MQSVLIDEGEYTLQVYKDVNMYLMEMAYHW